MRITRKQALVIAVACGILAAALSYTYLRRAAAAKTQQPQAPTTVGVVTAQAPVPVGKRIEPGMTVVKQVPQDQAPAGSFKTSEEVEGWVAVVPIGVGDPITQSNVREPTSALGLSFMIPEDMRAVTVPVDDVSGLSGLIKPGDHVDILATFELKDDSAITRTVLQDVEVLALSTTMIAAEAPKPAAAPAAEGEKGKAPAGGGQAAPPQGETPKKYPTATLAVTPGDAQKLVLADAKGKLRLTLRRAGDRAFSAVAPAVNWDLIGQRPTPPEEKAPPPPQQGMSGPPGNQPPPGWYPSYGPAPGAPGAGAPSKPAGPSRSGIEVVRGNQREVVSP
jgi:pilus assembly protein CpaB